MLPHAVVLLDRDGTLLLQSEKGILVEVIPTVALVAALVAVPVAVVQLLLP